ncbi:MAG: type II secretion system F family protein [Moraxellaceae bacterium]|nr:type II secretion system F family protein [Moraxellaceae bacterium]
MNWRGYWDTTPNTQQRCEWLKRLSLLLQAGIDLHQALSLLQQQTHAKQQHFWQPVILAIEQGRPLSMALQSINAFPASDLNLLEAAERTGKLAQETHNLAHTMAKRLSLHQQTRRAMRYPLIILSAAILISLYLLMRVVPSFVDLYASFNAELPWLTQALMRFSQWLSNYFYWLLLAAAAIVLITKLIWQRFAPYRCLIHQLMWHMPGLKTLSRAYWLQRWHRSLADCLQAGLPYLECLLTAEKVVHESPLAPVQSALVAGVSAGQPLSEPMATIKQYPLFSVQLIAVGEASGNLAKLISILAEQYELELSLGLAQTLKLIEPLLMALIGALVGIIVLALYLPLFQLGQIF